MSSMITMPTSIPNDPTPPNDPESHALAGPGRLAPTDSGPAGLKCGSISIQTVRARDLFGYTMANSAVGFAVVAAINRPTVGFRVMILAA